MVDTIIVSERRRTWPDDLKLRMLSEAEAPIAESTGSPIAMAALKKIAELYVIEKDIRSSPPQARVTARQERAKPLFEDLQKWFEAKFTSLPGKSALAGAIRYAISRMKRMGSYFESGICELDNNTAERSVKGMALGRKNYMFVGSDAGGERAAAIYSLIETAKLNGVNPQAWLTDVLARSADHPNQQDRCTSSLALRAGELMAVTTGRLR